MIKAIEVDEKVLLASFKAGDPSAFDYFYLKHRLKLYNRVNRLVQCGDIAEDLVQNAFIRIWNKRHLLKDDRSMWGYLLRIAENHVNDHFKKASSDRSLRERLMATATELYDHIEQTLHYKESQAILKEAIALLPPQRQRVFTLCKVDGKSYDEVSQLLGISNSTISDHIVKATKAIKLHFSRSEQSSLLLLTAVLLRDRFWLF